ncbi:hypothetical protein Tco_0768309 [Tanacetum coccineum]
MTYPPLWLRGLPFELEWDLLPCNLKPLNSFEWRKTVFEMITSMGIRHAKAPNPLRDTPCASLNVVFLFVLSQVIQNLEIPQASQNSLILSKPDSTHICTISGAIRTPPLRTRSPRVRRQHERVVGFEEVPNKEGSKTGRNTEGNRPSKAGAEENGRREMNLPPLLAAHPNMPVCSNPYPEGLFADPTGSVTPFVRWIDDYPLPDRLKMPSHVSSYDGKEDPDHFLHFFEGAIRMQKLLMPVACHMFTYTLKDSARICQQKRFMKMYLAVHNIKQREGESVRAFAIRDNFERSRKSSWDNDRGQKSRDRLSPYRRPNHGLLSSLSKIPRDILATEKAARSFEQPPHMLESRRSRDMSKYCYFHEDHGHDTNDCRQLRSQIEEVVKSGQLSHLVKGIKKERAKTSDSQRGEKKEKSTTPAEASILMINQEEACIRNNISKSPTFEGREITFPPVTKGSNSSTPVVIKAKIFRREVGRVHMDSGSSCEAIGEVLLEITIGDTPLSRSDTLNFVIVRSNSLYNMLLGRTAIRKIGMKIKETSPVNTKGVFSYTDAEEKIIVNSKYPEQTVTIRKQLPEHFKERFRSINMKLNPKKCTFGVEESPFLGHIITKQGIRANPSKVKAIADTEQPKMLKDIQSLNGKLAALSRFLSKGAERSLPFFKVLKSYTNKKNIQWTQEAAAVLQEMKKFVETLPTLTTLIHGEVLMMCLAASTESISVALFVRMEEGQVPIYFAHSVAILTNSPIKQALTKPEKSGRVAKWAIELGERDNLFRARGDNNKEATKDFLIEARPKDNRKEVGRKTYMKRMIDADRPQRSYTIEHIRRNQNKKADALSKLASITFEHLTKEVLVEILARRSIKEKEVLQVETKEDESWMTLIHEYLLSGLLLLGIKSLYT